MSHQHAVSAGPVHVVPSCNPTRPCALVEDAKDIIESNATNLLQASDRCNLRDLLSIMLDHAPSHHGQHYVASILRAANEIGPEAVVDAAHGWMEYLFFVTIQQMERLGKFDTYIEKAWPDGYNVSDSDFDELDNKISEDWNNLRETVAARQHYCCEISGKLDWKHTETLYENGLSWGACVDLQPTCNYMGMTSIIPFASLYKLDYELAGLDQSKIDETTLTRNMLCGWAGIDIDGPDGLKMNSPANAIYLSSNNLRYFELFMMYFDKDTYPNNPNKYKLRGEIMDEDVRNVDIEFHSFDENGRYIEPPDAHFLRVHAAFSKVLVLSGADSQFLKDERLGWDSEDEELDSVGSDEGSYGPAYEKDPGLLERVLRFMLYVW